MRESNKVVVQYQEVAEVLRNSKRLLLLSHYYPDGDAYGSSLGLTLALREMGKEVLCLNETKVVPQFLSFLPGITSIKNEVPADFESYDALVVVDCADLARTGDFFKDIVVKHKLIINIDHHPNPHFGKYNIVDVGASSTCELVFNLLEKLNYNYSVQAATCLLTGIYTDTISFSKSNATPGALRAAARLVEAGVKPLELTQRLFGEKDLKVVRFLSHAMQTVELHFGGVLGLISLTAQDFQKFEVEQGDAEELKNSILQIKGLKASVLIREQDGLLRVSLRSADERLDVASVATKFGGGGHKMAAAFRWRKGLAELKLQLLQEVEAALKKSGLL